jgi:hypothetical protein
MVAIFTSNILCILTSAELRYSLHTCIKIAQQEVYTQEMNDLRKKGQVSLSSQLQSLHPFLIKQIVFELVADYSIHIFHTILNTN